MKHSLDGMERERIEAMFLESTRQEATGLTEINDELYYFDQDGKLQLDGRLSETMFTTSHLKEQPQLEKLLCRVQRIISRKSNASSRMAG